MKNSIKLLISVGWLFGYNLAVYLMHNANTRPVNPALHYVFIAITYAPMLMALLVWFDKPKILYKALIKANNKDLQ